MRKSLWIAVFSVLVIAGSVFGKTPDGKPPSKETVCDMEKGAAFGLCNAYCEAMDCTDPNQHASDKGCEQVKANFIKMTGRPLPCETTCPCFGLHPLFAEIASKAVKVDRCLFNDNMLFVVTEDEDFALINNVPATCSVNGEGPIVNLTESQLMSCRIALRRAAEAQGVVCQSFE
jgi:hypothetical protein